MTFTTWRRISLGVGVKTGADFIPLLESARFGIGKQAEQLLERQTSVAAQECVLTLVKVSVERLALMSPTYSEICERAIHFGLHLCPTETGPQLRLQYLDQPEGEWVTVGMEPIQGDGGFSYIFGVARKDTFDCGGLSTCLVNKVGKERWRPQDIFVFSKLEKGE